MIFWIVSRPQSSVGRLSRLSSVRWQGDLSSVLFTFVRELCTNSSFSWCRRRRRRRGATEETWPGLFLCFLEQILHLQTAEGGRLETELRTITQRLNMLHLGRGGRGRHGRFGAAHLSHNTHRNASTNREHVHRWNRCCSGSRFDFLQMIFNVVNWKRLSGQSQNSSAVYNLRCDFVLLRTSMNWMKGIYEQYLIATRTVLYIQAKETEICVIKVRLCNSYYKAENSAEATQLSLII